MKLNDLVESVFIVAIVYVFFCLIGYLIGVIL